MTTKPTTTATARRSANKLNVYINKQQLCTWISLFCTFLCHLAPLRHEISLFDEPALWSMWTRDKNCRFLFLNRDNDRYGLKKKFDKICQIKWNWIRSVEFEIVRIDFQVTLSVCCHPNILLPLQREVRTSPLYWLICLYRNSLSFWNQPNQHFKVRTSCCQQDIVFLF